MAYDSQYEDLLRVPSDQTPIWRYLDFSNFLWIIKNSKIHFHRGDDFDDPFEGTTPLAVKQKRDESWEDNDIPDDTIHPSDLRKDMRKRVFLYCWHSNKYESAAMWDLYGGNEKTISIRSTVGGLKNAIEDTDFPIAIGWVFYANYQKEWEELDLESRQAISELWGSTEGMHVFEQYFLKQKSYEHEKEIRAALPAYGFKSTEVEEPPWDRLEWEDDDILDKSPVDTGLNVEVDLSSLIQNVYVAPDSPEWFRETVEQVLEQEESKLGNVSVIQSQLGEEPLY